LPEVGINREKRVEERGREPIRVGLHSFPSVDEGLPLAIG
jgi:hypothetical protein